MAISGLISFRHLHFFRHFLFPSYLDRALPKVQSLPHITTLGTLINVAKACESSSPTKEGTLANKSRLLPTNSKAFGRRFPTQLGELRSHPVSSTEARQDAQLSRRYVSSARYPAPRFMHDPRLSPLDFLLCNGLESSISLPSLHRASLLSHPFPSYNPWFYGSSFLGRNLTSLSTPVMSGLKTN